MSRNRTVTLGGRDDLWEFDGVTWRQCAKPLPAPHHGKLVYDSVRREVLCVGWMDVALWRYDGIRVQSIQPTTSPSPRTSFACSFDSLRGELVLFGGYILSGSTTNETWVFDGAAWAQRLPSSRPPARSNHALAYDSIRDRTVLFGGYPFGDTWEWNGLNWIQRAPAATPGVRSSMAMTFDPTRGRTVLFGGFAPTPLNFTPLDDTWEFDGVTWHAITPIGQRPPARIECLAVFDAARGESVLHGGVFPPDAPLHDAWSWNGTRWLALPAAPGQSVRCANGSVAAEWNTVNLIRFGGVNAHVHDETWRWNGTTWSKLAVPGPSPRVRAAMCTSFGVLLFGGALAPTGGYPYFNDLWRWDGSNWNQVPTSGLGPSPRTNTAMAYDIVRNEVVLFGGFDNTALRDSWIFDGTNWQQHQPVTRPPERHCHGMTYDLARGQTLLCGGLTRTSQALSDTWSWNGSDWSLVPVGNPPSPGGAATMAMDTQGLEVVLAMPADGWPPNLWRFDGQNWNAVQASQPLNHDWEVRAVGWPYRKITFADSTNLFSLSATSPQVVHYGSGCGTNAPDLTANRWPRLGAVDCGIDVVRGPASSFVALLGAVGNANLNVGSCTLLVQPGQVGLLAATSAYGAATVPIALPNNPAYLGVDLFFQAAALSPSSPAGFVLSRGLQITIGD